MGAAVRADLGTRIQEIGIKELLISVGAFGGRAARSLLPEFISGGFISGGF